MIHYHGGPHVSESVALRAWSGRHAFVSYAEPGQIELVASVCQSFALDNGAFSLWKSGRSTAWEKYYAWAEKWLNHPGCDWAVIPDVIEGTEEENDALAAAWPLPRHLGAPVWHVNESVGRLQRLCAEWPRVCIGSSGKYDVSRPTEFLDHMHTILSQVVDSEGRPPAKLHGLRMLNPVVFTQLPLSSADSTNVARNVRSDVLWRGTYQPSSRETRAQVMCERIESFNAAQRLPAEPPTAEHRKTQARLVRNKF